MSHENQQLACKCQQLKSAWKIHSTWFFNNVVNLKLTEHERIYKIFHVKHRKPLEISETRITRQVSLLNNLNLNNYSFEFTPTETSGGGTLLYIANHLSYKCHNDLNIY